ncbi:AraC family transcriptional regulator [Altererythrobacter arenosus]|uniref:AraC family transcriptional regulator n=1 Tax=Altererythrobacter arenosus TaxID=3032592 RepID=A0ABY8FVX1_9SPHN|nr:AraC family transcriptional regulator [Altererythrobacter sp. CAU 1644]WFL78385.1 AraC family transcriptional regulator [Altererythrobacter sp. CAU 1644]
MATAADYTRRIERALARIETGAASGDWPGLAELAEAAAMSEFHFHRIYRLLTGETPQQTLSRARLGGSLPALQGSAGIMAATERSAYATSQSYARALKALTGATPSELRADRALFDEVVEGLMRPVDDAHELTIEIAELSPLRLVATRAVGDYKDLNLGYYRLFDLLLEQIAPEQVTGLYGVPHDDPRHTPAQDCRFDCAVTTSAEVTLAGELTQIEVGGGPSLMLRIPGDYDKVHAALDHLYRVAIALELELAPVQPVNYYHHDPEEVPVEELVTDIHLMLAE